ncbi:hypothetical protein GKODMF_13855 [Candidatus Electrothrix gigas]
MNTGGLSPISLCVKKIHFLLSQEKIKEALSNMRKNIRERAVQHSLLTSLPPLTKVSPVFRCPLYTIRVRADEKGTRCKSGTGPPL